MQLLAFLTAKNDEWIIDKTMKRLSESADGIIAVDDGSTDRTYEIISSYSKVVKIIRNPPNGEWQIFRDMKKVFAEVNRIKPEWLMYIDSDDVLDVRFAEEKERLLSDKEAGRYHFTEVTLWGDNKHYRVDKPEWYGRSSNRTPYLVRWNPEVYIIDPYSHFFNKMLRWGRRQWGTGMLKRLMKQRTGDEIRKMNKYSYYFYDVFWPSDYMDYTNIALGGYKGKEIEVPLVKLHYHFADLYRAWRKHMNYALQSGIRQHRTPGEIPSIVDWASSKLNEEGMELKEVKQEWGVL